jgi:hypothetical protein
VSVAHPEVIKWTVTPLGNGPLSPDCPSWTELELKGSRRFGRVLNVTILGFDLRVMLIDPRSGQMSAYAMERLSKCYLAPVADDAGARALWIGRSAFRVSIAEANRIAAVFAEKGLRVEQEAKS